VGTLDAPHLTDLARANALVVVPEPAARLDAGTEVDCLLLERRRG
jgi:molybdopterin biosynthesis enzyme